MWDLFAWKRGLKGLWFGFIFFFCLGVMFGISMHLGITKYDATSAFKSYLSGV